MALMKHLHSLLLLWCGSFFLATSGLRTRNSTAIGGNSLQTAWSDSDLDESNYNMSEFAEYIIGNHVDKAAKATGSKFTGSATPNVCIKGKLVPVFYLIGAQKSATTSFAADFGRGWNVEFPKAIEGYRTSYIPSGTHAGVVKELHFFDSPPRYNRGEEF